MGGKRRTRKRAKAGPAKARIKGKPKLPAEPRFIPKYRKAIGKWMEWRVPFEVLKDGTLKVQYAERPFYFENIEEPKQITLVLAMPKEKRFLAVKENIREVGGWKRIVVKASSLSMEEPGKREGTIIEAFADCFGKRVFGSGLWWQLLPEELMGLHGNKLKWAVERRMNEAPPFVRGKKFGLFIDALRIKWMEELGVRKWYMHLREGAEPANFAQFRGFRNPTKEELEEYSKQGRGFTPGEPLLVMDVPLGLKEEFGGHLREHKIE